jgi:hypothetical protein
MEVKMKRLSALMLCLVATMTLLVVGCQKGTEPDAQVPPGVTNEEQAMKYFAENDEFVVNDEVTFTDKDVQPFEYGTFGKVDAAVTPLRFGRIVTNITRSTTVAVQPGDTISIALVQKTVVGTFKIRALRAPGDTITIEKPFTDQSKRNIIFKRVNRDTKRYWLNWVPVASSLVEGGTVAEGNQIDITKIDFIKPDGSTLSISDPQKYYMRYRWLNLFAGGQVDVPEYSSGQPVKLEVTLTSAKSDTDLVALRYGFSAVSARRSKLTLKSQVNNGNGTWTRVYEVSKIAPLYMHVSRGFFHMGIDAMTKATLFDDAAPYAVSWWGVPYKVK